MRVTYTIILNILHTAHNSVHITHIIFHITHKVVHMIYDMCYVYAVVRCVQNVQYEDACYYHGITFLIQIWKAHKLC